MRSSYIPITQKKYWSSIHIYIFLYTTNIMVWRLLFKLETFAFPPIRERHNHPAANHKRAGTVRRALFKLFGQYGNDSCGGRSVARGMYGYLSFLRLGGSRKGLGVQVSAFWPWGQTINDQFLSWVIVMGSRSRVKIMARAVERMARESFEFYRKLCSKFSTRRR